MKKFSCLLTATLFMAFVSVMSAYSCPLHKAKPGVPATKAKAHHHKPVKAANKDSINRSKAKPNAALVRLQAIALVAVALAQDPKDGGGAGGSGCLRPICNCTSSTHGSSACNSSGGDCSTHSGLLCIW